MNERLSSTSKAPSRRRTQVTSGLIAAVATLTPIVLSVRGIRPR